MKSILLPLCIPEPQGKVAHIKSRAKLEWNYHKYVCRAHDDITAAKRRMPKELFDSYFKFTFVRNPWERLVSEYEFLLRNTEHGRHARVSQLGSFSKFIHMQIPRHNAYQTSMLCNSKGKLMMDFIGKLENLENDWKIVCERIDIPYQALPLKNATPHKHYSEYYNTEDQLRVAHYWARDIELFNYRF